MVTSTRSTAVTAFIVIMMAAALMPRPMALVVDGAGPTGAVHIPGTYPAMLHHVLIHVDRIHPRDETVLEIAAVLVNQ